MNNRSSTCRDQTTHDHVFFQTIELIALSKNRSFCKNTRCFLERCSRDKRLCLKRCFGNTLKHRKSCCRPSSCSNHFMVMSIKLSTINLLTFNQGCIPNILHFNFLKHLANNHFDVLIVNSHTLEAINLLNFTNKISSQGFYTQNTQDIMWYWITINNDITRFHIVTILNQNVTSSWNKVLKWLLCLIFRSNSQTTFRLVILTKFYTTIKFSHNIGIFWLTCFKKLRNAWQTTRDVPCFRCFPWNLCKNITSVNHTTIFNGQNRVHRHKVP